MTDAMLGPLFTLVSIAIPVGIACLAVAATVAVAPRVVVLLRQRSYDRATVGERLYWTLRLDPAAAADPDGAVRLVAALHPGGRRGVSAWASGWPQLASRDPVGRRPRPLGDRGAAAARAIGRDGRRRRLSWGRARSSGRADAWMCLRSGSRSAVSHRRLPGPGRRRTSARSSSSCSRGSRMARARPGVSTSRRCRPPRTSGPTTPRARARCSSTRSSTGRREPHRRRRALSRHARRARCSR